MKFDSEMFCLGINSAMMAIIFIHWVGPSGSWNDGLICGLCLFSMIVNCFYEDSDE